MKPHRSWSSSALGQPAKSHTSAAPNHLPFLSGALPEDPDRGGRLGRYSVIPPLGQQWRSRNAVPGDHRSYAGTDLRGHEPNNKEQRPAGHSQRNYTPQLANQKVRARRRRHAQDTRLLAPPNSSGQAPQLAYPPAVPTGFHGVAVHHPLTTYPQLPMICPNYPPMSYLPPMPVPLMQPHTSFFPSPMQYMPPYPFVYGAQGYPYAYTLPEIRELIPSESPESMSESGEYRRPFVILQPPDELLLEVVSEEVCAQLVESCLPDLVRETVNSCISDIVTSYLGRFHLLPEPRMVRTPTQLAVKDGQQRKWHLQSSGPRPHTNPSQSIHEQRPSLPKSHMTLAASGNLETRILAPFKQVHTDKLNQLAHLESNSEVTRYIANMVLDELLFCQLLESVLDGGMGMALRIQTHHILNGLMFQTLLRHICSK